MKCHIWLLYLKSQEHTLPNAPTDDHMLNLNTMFHFWLIIHLVWQIFFFLSIHNLGCGCVASAFPSANFKFVVVVVHYRSQWGGILCCKWVSLDVKNCWFEKVTLKWLLINLFDCFFFIKTLFTIWPSREQSARSKLYYIYWINHHPFCTTAASSWGEMKAVDRVKRLRRKAASKTDAPRRTKSKSIIRSEQMKTTVVPPFCLWNLLKRDDEPPLTAKC